MLRFMHAFRIALICAAVLAVSCSRKSETRDSSESRQSSNATASSSKSEQGRDDNDARPAEDEIAEDCVAFVHTTKIIPPNDAGVDCPGCTAGAAGADALSFQQFELNRITCSPTTCNAEVVVRAAFNPGVGIIAGGLAAWLTPEHRAAYLQGKAPTGPQTFAVKVTYQRVNGGWRAIEFDRGGSR